MNLYYIRCHPADWNELLTLGEKLGAVQINSDESGAQTVTATLGGAWDFIGEIQQPTGAFTIDVDGNQVPVMQPIAAPDGTPYLHANLITPLALGELSISLRDADQTIAQALERLGKFFLLDADGNARLPSQPHRVFAS